MGCCPKRKRMGRRPPASHLASPRERGRAPPQQKQQAAIYGYKIYYDYRIEDPRLALLNREALRKRQWFEDIVCPTLALLKREWFEGKDCLDIGCNEGLVTIYIAKKYLCRSILGIEIDQDLIEDAYGNLRKECPKSGFMDTSEPPISYGDSALEHNTSESSDADVDNMSGDASQSKGSTLFERVSFKAENFLEGLQGCKEQYDTILCLSVAKWTYLNWGEDGMITLFLKIRRLLRPGGILLLEPQPWINKKKISVSEVM